MNSNCNNATAFIKTISEIGQSIDFENTTIGKYLILNRKRLTLKPLIIKPIMFLPVLFFFLLSVNIALSQNYNLFPTSAPWRTAIGAAQVITPNFKPLHLHTFPVFNWGGIPNNDPVFKISFGEDQSSQLSYGQLLLITPENNRLPGEIYSNIANYNPSTAHGDLVLQASYRAEDLILTTRSVEGCIRFGTSQVTNNDIERMTILPNGNVGINKTTPAYTLDLNGSCKVSDLAGTGTRMVVANSAGVLSTQSIPGGGAGWLLTGNALTTGNEFLGTTNNYNLKIRTNNLERLRVSSSNGFVGLGFPWNTEPTLAPIATLDVQVNPMYKQSKITFATDKMSDIPTSTGNTSIRLYRPVNGDVNHAYPWWIENRLAGGLGGEDGSLHFRTTAQNDIAAGSEDPALNPGSQLQSIMTLQRNGKVGVNNPSPRGFLDVAMDPGWNETKISMDILNHQPSLRLYKNTGVDHPECPNGRWSETYQWWMQLSDYEGGWGALQFLTKPPSCYPDDDVSPKVTFLPTGKVGINNTVPRGFLDVAMDPGWNETKISMDILNHQPSLRFYKNTGGDHPECPNGRLSETYQWWLQLSDYEGAWGSFQLLTRPASCYPNDEVSPVMTFQPNGNVGIGTQFPTEKLEINGTIKATNFNFTGTGDYKIGDNSAFISNCASLPPGVNTRLIVNGQILAKEVKVKSTCWPDYVFDDNYSLMSLSELSKYVKENKHLPGIPSESEINDNGVNIGEMQEHMMKKIEELTLYIIELEKKINKLEENRRNANEK